jgi:RimJ/RimL family protein N-acetyltransferase
MMAFDAAAFPDASRRIEIPSSKRRMSEHSIPSEPIVIRTARLALRQWRDSDRAPFARINADPRVMEFFPKTLDRQQSDAMVDRIYGGLAKRGWGLWATELSGTQEFIGFVGLNPTLMDLPFCPCVEIGWRLAADHWGKGYATEAARAALDIGFGTLGLDEIVSFTAQSNQRSQAVMQKLGMRRDDYEFDHPNIAQGHALRRHCLYRLSRQEWDVASG